MTLSLTLAFQRSFNRCPLDRLHQDDAVARNKIEG